MAKTINDKAHETLVKHMSSFEISPASMAYKMVHESRFVNESMIQYIINFIIIHGTRKEENVPPYLKDTWLVCNEMYQMLDKMDMTNAGSRSELNHTA